MSQGEITYVDGKSVDVSSADADVSGCNAIYIGSAGDLEVVFRGNSIGSPMAASVILTNLAAGFHRLRVKTIKSGGTSASGIVALY